MAEDEEKVVNLRDRGRPHREIDDPQRRLERIESLLVSLAAKIAQGDLKSENLAIERDQLAAERDQLAKKLDQMARERLKGRPAKNKASWRGQRFTPSSGRVSTPKQKSKNGAHGLFAMVGILAGGYIVKTVLEARADAELDDVLRGIEENPSRSLEPSGDLSATAITQMALMVADSTREVHHHHHHAETKVVNRPVPGPAGPRGVRGVRGLAGRPGKSLKGVKGESGRAGRDGRKGRDGRDGRDSFTMPTPRPLKRNALD